jgi:toxin HigB-1
MPWRNWRIRNELRSAFAFRWTYNAARSTLNVMIRTWKDSATRRFAESGKSSKFRGLDASAAFDLLAALDAATSLRDLSPLKSVGLHKLKGDRQGEWAMIVNGPWRICFEFRQGDAFNVEIVNYHRG